MPLRAMARAANRLVPVWGRCVPLGATVCVGVLMGVTGVSPGASGTSGLSGVSGVMGVGSGSGVGFGPGVGSGSGVGSGGITAWAALRARALPPTVMT